MNTSSGAPIQRYRSAARLPDPYQIAAHVAMSARNAKMANRCASVLASAEPIDSMKRTSPGAYSTGKVRYGVPGVVEISRNRERSSASGRVLPTWRAMSSTPTRSTRRPSVIGPSLRSVSGPVTPCIVGDDGLRLARYLPIRFGDGPRRPDPHDALIRSFGRTLETPRVDAAGLARPVLGAADRRPRLSDPGGPHHVVHARHPSSRCIHLHVR